LTGTGIAEVWETVGAYRDAVGNDLATQRADQARAWMWSEVTDVLVESLRARPDVAELARRLEADVTAGTITPTAAARSVLDAFLHGQPSGI
jgi:LAO/AO transport system kinase